MKKFLRPAVTALLAAALLFSAVFPAGAKPADQTLKILVASDLHYRPPGDLPPLREVNDLPDDPIFHHANTKGMLVYEADAVLDAFFSQARRSGAKYLLIPGDLCENHLEDHLALAEKLRAFQKRSGIRVFVVPGNHIKAAESADQFDLADFLEIYAELGFDRALARREGDASYTAELDDTRRLLAIDGCIYGSNDSLVTPELFAWIEAQILAAREDGKKLLAMTHFNVLEHYLIEGFADGSLCIDGHRRLATALADGGVKYVFTGHGHANDIAYTETRKGNRLFDIETGSLITYPLAWREVTFSGTGVRLEAKYIGRIDTSLLPEGFSRAQIDAMRADFPKYSFDFVRAGFRSFANQIPQITRRLARNLKIPAGTAAYAAIGRMFDALMGAAKIPVDGEYKDPLDLAGVIYAGHFAGNERYPVGSPEMRLLGQAVSAILHLPNLPYPFARQLVKALADGVITDWSAPDDLNVTLEPWGEQWALDGYAVKSTDFRFALDIAWRIAGLPFYAAINMTDR